MSTLLDELQQGIIPPYLQEIARKEELNQQQLIKNIRQGRVVIPRNRNHQYLQPIAIGTGSSVKVNANVGTSPSSCEFEHEIEKAEIAVTSGADAVMDLSIAGDAAAFRTRILQELPVTLGTVPLYEAMSDCQKPEELTVEKFLNTVRQQAEEGVDFMTIHAGLRRQHLSLLETRELGVVSRGGAVMVQWMRCHQKESFLYEHFDEILEIMNEYDITMSLGDGLRPGCTADANDAAQFGELEMLGELVQRCRTANVQVMVEGPGHVPLHLIEENVRKEKEICDDAPFYVLGPLVIDYAAGYDHIAGAIGGALAALHGTDFLCYVTPAEHLRLPTLKDVQEGVIASKIAAAAADLSRKKSAAIERNLQISRARKSFDWEKQQKLAIDPAKFCRYLETVESQDPDDPEAPPCSMCGEWCAIKRDHVSA